MTTEEIKTKSLELAALYTARANGKTLQYRIALDGPNQWMDYVDGTGPHLVSELSHWRIKPDPRTFWVWLNQEGEVVESTRYEEMANQWRKDGHTVAETVEVLP